MKYTYQYKVLPTTQQKLELNLWLRICQYWYNRQLGDRFEWWELNRSPINACPLVTHLPELRDKPNYYSQKKYLPNLKKEPVVVQWSGQKLDFSRVLTRRNAPKQDETGAYISNGQSAKSGLNLSWADAAFGQFFEILGHIAAKAGAIVVAKNPAYTSQLLSYRDEFIFTDRNIREYWDEVENLLIDRDINAAINIKRLGLDVFPSIKCL
jgi:transposase